VSNRIELGRKASQLRKTGQTIANIFGEDAPSQAISLNRSVVLKYLKAEGDSGLVYLVAEDKTETPVLIEEIQYDAW
jgi:ribosomal protein L25 (general stress protein Ctc)